MHLPADVNTPFAISLDWWRAHHRNLHRFLADIVGDEAAAATTGQTLDFVDPDTAEVHELDPVWVRVLVEHAHKPDYIGSTTPMATAVLRALIENMNRPMTPVDLYRRINRTSPDTILRLMRTAEAQYGIVPIAPETAPRRRSR